MAKEDNTSMVKKVTGIACSPKEAEDSNLGIEEGYIKKQFSQLIA